MSHPGSVVWPAVLAAVAHSRAAGEDQARRLIRAAAAGYATMAVAAGLFAPAHGSRLHLTATAGYVAAAVAASVAQSANRAAATNAVSHAASVAGGVGQAALERAGTLAFHRAAAVTVGLAASAAAASGLAASLATIEGPSGLLAAWSAAAPGELPDPLPGSRPSLRVYPVNGFLQALVDAILIARAGHVGDPPSSLTLLLARSAEAAGRRRPGTVHDDPREVAARLWVRPDPWRIADPSMPSELSRVRGVVRVEPVDRPVGSAGVEVSVHGRQERVEVTRPRGWRPSVEDLSAKWRLPRPSGPDPLAVTDDLLSGRVRVNDALATWLHGSLLGRGGPVDGIPDVGDPEEET
jgi:hypothetical protein